MKKILLYAVAKDLSIWIIYFILMKYNLTGQTYTSATVANFPGAPKMDVVSMIFASLYISFLPLLLDVVILGILRRYILKAIPESGVVAVLIGLLLHVPVILFWTFMSISNMTSASKASNIGMALSFIVAGGTMLLISRCTIPKHLKPLKNQLLQS